MSRNLTVRPNVLHQDTRAALDGLIDSPIPVILRKALQAAREADDGMTSAPQHSLYGVLEALYAWRAEAMPTLQEPVRDLYAAAMRRGGLQTVHSCAVREMLGLASCIADGGRAERIGVRIGGLCHALAELRQGPLLAIDPMDSRLEAA